MVSVLICMHMASAAYLCITYTPCALCCCRLIRAYQRLISACKMPSLLNSRSSNQSGSSKSGNGTSGSLASSNSYRTAALVSQLQYRMSVRAGHIAWLTNDFELYATFDPLTQRVRATTQIWRKEDTCLITYWICFLCLPYLRRLVHLLLRRRRWIVAMRFGRGFVHTRKSSFLLLLSSNNHRPWLWLLPSSCVMTKTNYNEDNAYHLGWLALRC